MDASRIVCVARSHLAQENPLRREGRLRTVCDVFSDDDIARMIPLKRAGTPEEVAHLVGFLTSSEAAYVTGRAIPIRGGMA